MKKILAILCSAALALTLCNGVFADTNIALDGTAIADGVHPTYGGDIVNLNDGDVSNRWQSARDMVEDNGDTAEVEKQTDDLAPWCGIYWDSAKNIASLKVWFEASDPAENGYDIYYAADYAGDATVWTQIGYTATRDTENCGGNNDSDNDSTDTITLNSVVTAEAIKLVGRTAENKNVTLSVWEFEVYEGTPSQGGNEQPGGGADTGVASTLAFAVVAMAAGAVALKSKKNAD